MIVLSQNATVSVLQTSIKCNVCLWLDQVSICCCYLPGCNQDREMGIAYSILFTSAIEPANQKQLLSVEISLFFFYILFIFRKIKHFLIAGLIRSFKRLLDYRRFSSRTWHIFSASYIQIDCLHNLSLWRNHKKIGILVLLSFFWRFVSLKNAFNVVITRNDILNESQN